MGKIQRRTEVSVYDCQSDDCLDVINGRAQVDVITAPPSGGGTQYTEGDVDATITGTAAMWEDAADTLRAVSVAKPLPAQIGDGTRVATVRDTGANDSLNVAITDATGGQITSFGGGTQYTEGDIDASITGTAAMWEDAADTLRVASVAKPLPTQISDGTRTATVRDTGANDSLNVAITDAAGGQITSFGGGTQYTEGDVDASITGTAVMWEDGADTLRAVSAAKPLPVDTELPAAAALADNVANPSTSVVAAYVHGRRQGGTSYDRVTNEVATSDTVGATDDRGLHISDLVKIHSETPTNINAAYDVANETLTSAAIDVRRFRSGQLAFTLNSEGAPTDIRFELLFSDAVAGNYHKLASGYWADLRFDDTICATPIDLAYDFPIMGAFLMVRVVSAGGSSSLIKFDVTNARVILRN